MNRPMGSILLAIGIILLIMGLNASDSFSSALSRLFNGAPTTQTIWLLISGVVCTISGWILLGGRPK